MRTTLLAVSLVLVVACGGGDAGGGPTGGTGPTGQTGPTGPTGPIGPTGPTGGTGPSQTASVRLERLDDHAECDGLVPDHAPEPVDVRWQAPNRAVCDGGISDGSGHVAVSGRPAYGGAVWLAVGPDGSPHHQFVGLPLLSQPSGWHGLTIRPRENTGTRVLQQRFSPEGDVLAEADANSDPDQLQSEAWSLAQDPKGGCFTLVGEIDLFHNHWTRLEAQRFDEAGRPRWPEPLAFNTNDSREFLFVAAGISVRGDALALRQSSSAVDVTWIRPDGARVAEEMGAEPYAELTGSPDVRKYQVELAPLLDGDLAVRVDGTFRRRYPHLGTRTAALPGWLAARADWSFRFTRGNRGYALFPPRWQAAPRCDQAIELLAPSGRLCGRVTLVGDGSACETGVVDQGWDGTVVQQREKVACEWRFWPGLLAR